MSVFRELADENYLVGLHGRDLVARVAAFYGQLNALHPFREGNGRTQRAFLTQLGRLGGWRLRWSDLDRSVNNEASRTSLERGDDDALADMISTLLDEETSPTESGAGRRVVLARPDIAEIIPGGMEELRKGPYPAEAQCLDCRREYALVDEPSVVSLRPMPPPEPGIVTFSHARCSRSRVLPQPSTREVRAWRAIRDREGTDSTGVAIVLFTEPPRAAFAWRLEVAFIRKAGTDVHDLYLGFMTGLGLRPSAELAPPAEPTYGWSVAVGVRSRSITVTGADGVRQFAGDDMDLPEAWLDAVSASGDCVLYFVSRGEIDPDGLRVAAQQGRVAVGLAPAVLNDT